MKAKLERIAAVSQARKFFLKEVGKKIHLDDGLWLNNDMGKVQKIVEKLQKAGTKLTKGEKRGERWFNFSDDSVISMKKDGTLVIFKLLD